MGWLFSQAWPTKGTLIAHLTKEQTEGDNGNLWTQRTIAKCVRGTTLYAVKENVRDGTKNQFLFVAYMSSHVKEGDGWGYKAMSESDGPTEAQCPPSYFKMVGPPPNQFAADWRSRCVAYAKRMARKPQVGEIWKLLDTCKPGWVKITSVKPLIGSGMKVPKRLLDRKLGDSEALSDLFTMPDEVFAELTNEARI